MAKTFKITEDQKRWARRRYDQSKQFWIDLIQRQGGKCALTGAPLLFNKKNFGTPQKGGKGCHPLYVSADHKNPQRIDLGLEIICYDINDLKGHLPPILFDALKKTKEWRRFVKKWKKLAESSKNRRALKRLIKVGA